MSTLRLRPQPVTREAFAPYGEVIDPAGHRPLLINEGLTERYHALAGVEVGEGRAIVSIFRSQPKPLPIPVRGMERHPHGSQAFVPLQPQPFLVLVAATPGPPEPGDLRLFVTTGQQGVNYRRNVWHHYCLALEQVSEFVVVDREGVGENLEEMTFSADVQILLDVAGGVGP